MRIFWMAAAALTALMSATGLRAGDVVLYEDFDTLDVAAILPAGYTLSKPDDKKFFSMVEEMGRGKVLRLNHTGGSSPALNFTLDPKRMAGKAVRFAVSAKFPGAYIPNAAKPQAVPKVVFTVSVGNKATPTNVNIQAGKPEWQELFMTVNVAKDATAVSLSLRIEEVAAEVFFDRVSVESEPEVGSQPPTSRPDPNNRPSLAARSPKKTIEEGGFTFSPELSTAMQAALNFKAVPKEKTVLFCGPGTAEAPKTIKNWTTAAPDAKVATKIAGVAADPRQLLIELPNVLLAEKPTVVVIMGDNTVHKGYSSETNDWQDVAKLCLRLGSIPVMAMPPPPKEPKDPDKREEKENSALFMKRAADIEGNLPLIQCATAEQTAERTGLFLNMANRHILGRTVAGGADAQENPGGKKPVGKPGADE